MLGTILVVILMAAAVSCVHGKGPVAKAATTTDSKDDAAATARFMPMDLAGYANDGIDWVLHPPAGRVTFDGIPFVLLTGPRAAVKSATIGRPTWPTTFAFPVVSAGGIRRVHAILSGSWVDQEAGTIGQVNVVYETGAITSVELIKNRTIQEGWRSERDLFGSSTPASVPGVAWRTVYTEPQQRGPDKAIGFLDVLSVDTDPARTVTRIELLRVSKAAGFQLAALTLER